LPELAAVGSHFRRVVRRIFDKWAPQDRIAPAYDTKEAKMAQISFWARGDSATANNASINSQGTNKVATTQLKFVSGPSGDLNLDHVSGGGIDQTRRS